LSDVESDGHTHGSEDAVIHGHNIRGARINYTKSHRPGTEITIFF
jgi:hypothetical protein